MRVHTFVDRLLEQGLDPTEAARKRSLYIWLFEAFPALTSNTPTDALWIPGRIEVFGKHTDYAGGRSLVATVPRGFGFLAHYRDDRVVNMKDVARDESFTIDTGNVETTAGGEEQDGVTGWRRYAATVVGRLSRNFPGARLGADIVFASDLPPASGMSSSSALIVGLAEMLGRLADIHGRPEWIANVRAPWDAAGYYACIENGKSFGTLAGDAGVGTHGGSEDHVAMICGRARQLSAWKFVPIQHIVDVAVPDGWTFVIASSGAAAKKTGSAKDSYNRLSRHAKILLDLWNGAETTQRSLHDAMTSDDGAPDRLMALLRARTDEHPSSGELEHRLTHFLREDGRVLGAVNAFRSADSERLTTLAEASQSDAEMLLRNQVPETIALTRTARRLGAFAASSFGAGFGGSVWALIERERAELFTAAWLTEYRREFPERTAATTFFASPGPGLTFLS